MLFNWNIYKHMFLKYLITISDLNWIHFGSKEFINNQLNMFLKLMQQVIICLTRLATGTQAWYRLVIVYSLKSNLSEDAFVNGLIRYI
jgi:hypothetical protein